MMRNISKILLLNVGIPGGEVEVVQMIADRTGQITVYCIVDYTVDRQL